MGAGVGLLLRENRRGDWCSGDPETDNADALDCVTKNATHVLPVKRKIFKKSKTRQLKTFSKRPNGFQILMLRSVRLSRTTMKGTAAQECKRRPFLIPWQSLG